MLPLLEKLFTNYISARKTFLEQITESDSRKFDSGIGDFPMGRPKAMCSMDGRWSISQDFTRILATSDGRISVATCPFVKFLVPTVGSSF